MYKNEERYSDGILSDCIVNYISDVRFFRQKVIKKQHLAQML